MLRKHSCEQAEFKKFLACYPRELTTHGFMDRTTYHDFELGELEDSIVANEGWGYYDAPIDYWIADMKDVRKLYWKNKLRKAFRKISRK